MKISNEIYSFDDEIILNSVFDHKNKLIVVFFESFYKNNKFIETPCRLIIKNWIEANKNECGKGELFSLGENLEVFELLLSIEKQNNFLKLIVSTTDNRYLELRFKEAEVLVFED